MTVADGALASDAPRTSPSAMAAPVVHSFPRRPGSIRRTSHIDMTTFPDGLILDGAARDLVTTRSGEPTAVAEARVHARVGPDRTLQSLETIPAAEHSSALLGCGVGAGFRDAVHRSFAADVEDGTPLAVLLDDIPVAALISGYAQLYSGALPKERSAYALKSDICSGWRSTGTMMVSVRDHGSIPIPLGPPAPMIDDDDDALAWHDIGELAVGAMRRRRMIDITPGDVLDVRAMFRDTHVDADGAQTVLHEYSLTAAIDASTLEILACDAVPRVLPWVECPVAAASATQLVGHRVGDVRSLVRNELRGTSTCTHLNDLLRSLGDVASLTRTLARAVAR